MKRIIVSACLLLTFACGLPSLEAQQQRDKQKSGSGQQTILPNSPPIIKSFTSSSPFAVIPCPYGVTPSAPDCTPPGKLKLKLKTEASDPDADTLLYTYSVSGGQIVGDGPEVTWNLGGVAPGPYEAKLIVDDGLGGTASSSLQIMVQECGVCPNACPALNISCPEDIEERQPLVCSINVSGGDPDLNITYNWSVSDGTIKEGRGTPTIEIDTTGLAGKEVTVTAEVGGLPLSCEKSKSSKVQIRQGERRTAANKPPVIKSFTSEAGTVAIPCPDWRPNALSCTPSQSYKIKLITDAADPDGDALRYEYVVTGGEIIGEGSNVEWSYKGLNPGTYTAKVFVKNQHGGITSKTFVVSVIPCPICDPPCPTLSISCPEFADAGQPLTFSLNISGGDPDMKPIYKWTVSAGTIITGQGTPTIVIDTKGLAGKRVMATVEVGDINPSCQRTTSCEVPISKKDGGEKQ
jgi:hypothetical protein